LIVAKCFASTVARYHQDSVILTSFVSCSLS